MKIELTRGYDGETVKAGEVEDLGEAVAWWKDAYDFPCTTEFWSNPSEDGEYEIFDFGSHEYFGRLWNMKQYRVEFLRQDGRVDSVKLDFVRYNVKQAINFLRDLKNGYPNIEMRLTERDVGEWKEVTE